MGEFTVEDFVRVETALTPSFAHDGTRVAFRSDRPGQPQAYVVDAAGEPAATAQRLTDTEGVVYDIAWRPGHNELLIITDDGGDEQYQLHLVDVTTGATRPLASAPRIIHNFGAWSADGRLLSFASNRRDRAFFDVYVLDVESGDERRVFEDDQMNAAGHFAPDGRSLIVSRPNLDRAGDNDVFLVDATGGGTAPRALTAHDGVAHWSDAQPLGAHAVLALSDEDREFVALQRIDLRTGTREHVLMYDWDVEEFAVAPAGDRVALTINADGYSRLEVYALTTDGRPGAPVPTAEIPRGVITGLSWRPDGRALAVGFESARAASDIWLVDLDAGSWAHVTASNRHGIPEHALPEPRLVHYSTFDGREIPAFLYLPERADATAPPPPCLVLVHGGPEGQSRPALWGRYAAPSYLLATGRLALLVPNVRGSTGYGKEYAHADDVEKRMDSVRDLLAAADWLAASGLVDPQRIGVMGGSYGGFMTLAAITEAPARWAVAVDLFGIANFVTFMEQTGPWRRRWRATEYGDDPAFLASISPIHKADRIRTPLLVIQGDHDVRVPPIESQQIADTVRRNEGVVEYIVFEREGHGIQRLPNRLEMARRIAAFVGTHLLGE